MPEDQVRSVSQITLELKSLIEANFRNVWIQGEISNFKQQSSGHFYFSLKDEGAQMNAVMFRGQASHLKTLPKDGDQVIVCGELNVYAPRGNYQIVIRELYFVGLGALLQRLEELKKTIAKRGWFRKEHKKPLPRFPRRIGIITSPTGAVIRDILNVLQRRHSGLHILLNPVKVQGAESAREIAAAVRQFNEQLPVDVLIIGRGGGSLEDLWAFNEEIVAQAIFESHIPIICAVGHETDHTIAEYVADLRAPTPSAAAELVIAEKRGVLEFLHITRQRLFRTLQQRLAHAKTHLERYTRHPAMRDPYYLIGHFMQRLDEARSLLDHRIHSDLQKARLTLVGIERSLRAINPKGLLSQGYSILFSEKEGRVISSIDQVKAGMHIKALLSDGEIKLKVYENNAT
ncbi:MAG: exodeoxyribonuclease VII large subunit [Verrucomicrobia bacterium]|nr:exodeoxyribonuclease VII large subunit [Verrucomicrobiota bacterium]